MNGVIEIGDIQSFIIYVPELQQPDISGCADDECPAVHSRSCRTCV